MLDGWPAPQTQAGVQQDVGIRMGCMGDPWRLPGDRKLCIKRALLRCGPEAPRLAEGTVSRPLSYPAPPTLTRGRYWPLCADAEARRSCRWDHAQVSARCLTRPVAACGG